MNVAIGTQVYLPYTQSWIYRQINDDRSHVSLVVCNKKENLETFPFDRIAVIQEKSLWWRKVAYKLRPVLKYFPHTVSSKRKKAYTTALVENNIQLMHVHFGVMAVDLMGVCETLNVPLIVTFHGFDITAAVKRSPSYHKALLILFDKMKVGIAISHEMKNRLVELGCAADKVKVSYLGIPLKEFKYLDRSHHAANVKFLHAGRLSETKGVPDLVRAFSSAFSMEDAVELFIVGGGEERENVMEAIHQSPIKDKIKFLGKLSNEELLKYREACDVFVLNCRTPESGDKEGLPIALLEASSMGLPIVSTYHAGISEGIVHQQTGLLVKEYDNKGLADAMRLLLDKNTRLQMGKQGRAWMEEQFDLGKCNEVLYDIYQQTVLSK